MILNRTIGWIGVDVGTCTVKMAQVRRDAGRFVLRQAAVIRRATPWQDSPTLQWTPCSSHEELASARAVGEGFSGRLCASTIPMALCELRGLQLVDPTPANVHRALQASLPATGDHQAEGERIVDFWTTQHPAEARAVGLNNVSVLSVARKWSLQIAADLQSARLACRVLDGTPLALARAVAMDDGIDKGQVVGVLDWGFSRATFCVVLDGRPLFVRCLRDGGFGRLVDLVQNTLAVSGEEAGYLVAQHACSGGPADQQPAGQTAAFIQQLVADTLAEVATELQRTLTYLRTHRKPLVPTTLLLFGGGATMKNVASFCAACTELATRTWRVAASVDEEFMSGDVPFALLGSAMAMSALAMEV